MRGADAKMPAMRRHPTWLTAGFALTFVTAWYLSTGLIGYKADRPFAGGNHWSGAVIWSEVAMGLGAGIAAAFCWWRGIRNLTRSGIPGR